MSLYKGAELGEGSGVELRMTLTQIQSLKYKPYHYSDSIAIEEGI